MKLAEIKTDTMIYAAVDRGGPARYRVVVLDTARWREMRGAPGEVTRYVPAPPTGTGRGSNAYGEHAGMLALQAGGWRVSPEVADAITDADLLDLAAKAAVDIGDHTVPVLPTGVSVRILRPHDVDGLWSDYAAALDAARRRTEREAATRAARAAVQAAARDRVLARVAAEAVGNPASGMTWTKLEAICMAYAGSRMPADG